MKTFDETEHVYRDRGARLPGATDAIRVGGLVDAEWFTEEARWRGKVVHRGVELLLKNELDWETVDDSVVGYLSSAQKFIAVTKFAVLGSESPLFADGFGCMPDLWGILNGAPTVVEFKTGAVAAWTAFQTALQVRALAHDRGFKATKRFGLRLLADGRLATLRPFEDPRDDYRAMSLVDLFHWKTDNGYMKDWK